MMSLQAEEVSQQSPVIFICLIEEIASRRTSLSACFAISQNDSFEKSIAFGVLRDLAMTWR
jgi:hypothetical protein